MNELETKGELLEILNRKGQVILGENKENGRKSMP
jgi:hypothetical protein